jgi:hypothetical protein
MFHWPEVVQVLSQGAVLARSFIHSSGAISVGTARLVGQIVLEISR